MSNRYRNHYGTAISLGEGFSALLDRENIVVPKDDIFCASNNTLPIPYISLESPYAKYGIRAESNGGFTTITGCQITGEAGFDEASQAVGIYTNHNPMVITGSRLENLNHGFIFAGGNENGEGLAHLTRNKFENNMSNIELKNGTIDFQLRCNEFKTDAIPTGQTRYGLRIEGDAGLVGNRIGGSPSTTPVGEPNGNFWPISDPTWNLTTNVEPQPVSGFISIQNQTDHDITYWRYHNEFVGEINLSGAGDILFSQLTPTTYMWTPQTLINRCQQTGNCGAGGNTPTALQACTTAILQGGECNSTLPEEIHWVRPCSGAFTDNILWPLPVFARPGNPATDSVTAAIKEEPEQLAALGICVPNPATSKTRIPFFLPEKAGGGRLWVADVSTGRHILSVSLTKPGQGSHEMDVRELRPGIYAYGLIPASGKAPETRKFVVIR